MQFDSTSFGLLNMQFDSTSKCHKQNKKLQPDTKIMFKNFPLFIIKLSQKIYFNRLLFQYIISK